MLHILVDNPEINQAPAITSLFTSPDAALATPTLTGKIIPMTPIVVKSHSHNGKPLMLSAPRTATILTATEIQFAISVTESSTPYLPESRSPKTTNYCNLRLLSSGFCNQILSGWGRALCASAHTPTHAHAPFCIGEYETLPCRSFSCREFQLAKEVRSGEGFHRLFTQSLVETLRRRSWPGNVWLKKFGIRTSVRTSMVVCPHKKTLITSL
ncbi:uncharacterized protein BT62DRAFT_1081780 [Guyanagaster necrorhizus]|uniref:Uncharacterized protein n=1 Tax=Guyanagaster necrorhizus TaxID=856835 RepID=A0A9P7VEK0_9AGAR|nr:uncharacterized protein BT62DRAFT_1081780 [Guyanagaster necrorhizus MCA 3950]KAG7439122.1 hypothetical protein BT62DRAFT_1081780 [Guyanagaster necrorhizus MCA 3950]